MQSATQSLLRKPLPTLAQWIGDGARADGFEDWVRCCIEQAPKTRTADESAALRILQTVCIAFVEAGRAEIDRHGRKAEEVILHLPRIGAYAAMMAIISMAREDADLCELLELLTPEMLSGAKMAVESVMRSRGK